MTTRQNRTKRSSRSRRNHKPSPWSKTPWLRRLPRWAWWIGGLIVVILYVWAFYYFFVGPTGFRWRALYGDTKYPEGFEIHGIDISHYQGEIDWEELSNAMVMDYPLRFVIVKSTEGSTRLDKRFRDNFANAREYGFIRGAYHFGATSRAHARRLTISWTRYT